MTDGRTSEPGIGGNASDKGWLRWPMLLATAIVLACAVLWALCAAPVYRQTEIDSLNRAARDIVGTGRNAAIEPDGSLISKLQEAEAELDHAQTVGDPEWVRQILTRIDIIQDDIRAAAGAFPVLDVAVVLTGVLLQILCALVAVCWLGTAAAYVRPLLCSLLWPTQSGIAGQGREASLSRRQQLLAWSKCKLSKARWIRCACPLVLQTLLICRIREELNHWPRDQIERLLEEHAKRPTKAHAELCRWCSAVLARFYKKTKEEYPATEHKEWLALSKALFRVGKICARAPQDQKLPRVNLDSCDIQVSASSAGQHDSDPPVPPLRRLRRLHLLVQLLLWLDTAMFGGRRLLKLLIFLGAYWGIARLSGVVLGPNSEIAGQLAGVLRMYGSQPATRNVFSALSAGILVVGCGAIFSRHFVQSAVRWFAEKSQTELDDVLTTAFAGPATAGLVAIGVYLSLSLLPPYLLYSGGIAWRTITQDGLPILLTAVLGTWVGVIIFNRVAMHGLERWAKATEQQFDDMFARLLRIFGTFVIVAVVGALLILKYQEKIGALTGIDNVLLPYSIVVSVLTAVLGYSVKEGVEVFFGSYLLQVDKPFEVGERLMLETGEVCDVRKLGIRTTVLHNVLDNTEVSIPNRSLIAQKVTNISRPDRELRIHVAVRVQSARVLLKRAEAMLLDIAYFEPEIDQTCLMGKEVPTSNPRVDRATLSERLSTLVDVFSDVAAVRAERILGRGEPAQVLAVQKIRLLLEEAEQLRTEYGEAVKRLEEPVADALSKAILSAESLEKDSAGGGGHRLRTFCRNRLKGLNKVDASDPSEDQIDFFLNDLVSAWRSLVREIVSSARFMQNKLDLPEPQQLVSDIVTHEISEVSRRGVSVDAFLRALAEGVAKRDRAGTDLDDQALVVSRIADWMEREDARRYAILLDIAERMGEISELTYAIGDSDPQMRSSRSMDQLVGELGKEPLVRSSFGITEEGVPFTEISLAVYSTHLERKYEVTHKLHKEIQQRFRQNGFEVLPAT